MEYLDFFAPPGWTITYNPKLSSEAENQFSYTHETYDGANGLSGTAKDYLNCIHGVFEKIRKAGMSEDIVGNLAPDLCRLNVKLLSTGELVIREDVYTGNTYTDYASLTMGKKNGKKDKLAGNGMYITNLHKSPKPSSPNLMWSVHPGYDIETGVWCTLDKKDKYIAICKEAIRLSLVSLIDQTKEQLINLMQGPGASKTLKSDDGESMSL